jgi:hypothetical protein
MSLHRFLPVGGGNAVCGGLRGMRRWPYRYLGRPEPLWYAYDAGLSASRSQCEGRWDREILEWESQAKPSPAGLG